MATLLTELLFLLLFCRGQVYAASFFGDSSIQLQTVQASSQTLLRVQFRTSSRQGLLFLAAGPADFLLLEVTSGRLQVRVDLGSGEHTLRSERDINLSDLAWHSVEVTHTHHHVSITVDRSSHSRIVIPGPDPELSVDALFVGGASGLNFPHILNISAGFRGCLDEVILNELNLLSSLKSFPGYKKVHEVSLGCSELFSATEADVAHFFSSKAFISLSPWDPQQKGMFECELHPSGREADGIVLYSSGILGGVLLEIKGGHLVATVGTVQGNKTELHSRTHLYSKLTWYPIQFQLLPHTVQLRVGEELLQASLGLRSIHLEGPLFLGGTNEQAWREAKQTGLISSDTQLQTIESRSSFRGCLREIKVNTQRTGLPHAVVSKDISLGCKVGQHSETMSTTRSIYVHEFDITTAHGISDNNDSNLLFLRRLEVEEGSRAPLEPKHIKVNVDLPKLGLHPSEFMFRIEEQPVQGHLHLDPSPEPKVRMTPTGAEERHLAFSMLDLWQGRVSYVHSGSEGHHDYFMFSIYSGYKELPLSLTDRHHLYRFDISISPVNDAPVLSLPQGNVFTLLQKSKRLFTTDVLRVSDPDSSQSDLVFSAMGNLNNEAGHLEHKDQPGRAINVFSLYDLKEGKINFVHTGVSTTRLAFRVSDGQMVSNPVILRILAVELEYKFVNNTALEVNQGGASVITINHLAVQVNVAEQPMDIRYDVTELPQYGQLQRLHSSGEWRPTTFFTQKLIEKERIRYLNTYRAIQTQNATDRLKCKVSAGSIAAKKEIVFPIVVRWIHYKVTRSKMEVNGVLKVVVTPEDLHVITKGVKLNDSDIYFKLLTKPKKGQLFLIDKVLKINSTFSQKNITDGLVTYELFTRLPVDTRDICIFRAFSTIAISMSHDFRINIRTESTDFTVLNNGLSVVEGGTKIITKSILFTHIASNRDVHYSITVQPSHGQIRRIDISNSTSINDNIGIFTNQDIIEERVMYVHDDSETKQDFFRFQIVVYKPTRASGKNENRNPVEHTVNISIQLINDQRPVRVVDQVFHMARDGQRLVTLNDLCYRDDDSDFEDDWLVYTRRGIPMGELVLTSAPDHKLYEFTQRDLKQKKVLFVHSGVSFGRFVLFVSDGKHYVSTLMEVKAQDPYIEVKNNTGLMVQQGGITTLTSCNLSIFSNLDIRDSQQLTYEVFLPPKHGVLLKNDGESAAEADAVSLFTQEDLEAERLFYHHDGSHGFSDGFNITARAREKTREGRSHDWRREVYLDIGLQIKIYLKSHQSPPTVINNRPVVVAEGHNVSLNKNQLEVVHVDSQPSEIVFTVQSPPSLGLIEMLTSEKKRRTNNEGRQHRFQKFRWEPTTSFTQEDINNGLVIYHQQTSGSANDSALLEATNGVTKVGPIYMAIDIIPTLLPLQVSDLTLDEGSSLPLTLDVITVNSHHFSGMNFLYNIVVPPRHGHLEHSRIPGMPITAFTHTELEREYISYIHDGSDTVRDNFTIIVNQTEYQKHSLPCTVQIKVTPVNDETPVVITNNGLKVWVDSVTEISVDDLSAEDCDTPPDKLEFIVTPPSNGYLALKSAPSKHILNFTQIHIESGQLLFAHNGALSGGFHFQVNDGVNYANRQIFSTTAHSFVLTLQKNHPVEVYPGSVTPISEHELQVITSNPTDVAINDTLVYTVTVPPKLGRLVRRMPDNSTQDISTFTQRMVNSGVVLYDQNKPESVVWLATDTFSFTVSYPPIFLPPHTFTILISYQVNKHLHYLQHDSRTLHNAGAVVSEGGRIVIDRSKLDASHLLEKLPKPFQKDHHVVYRLTSLPRHGALSIHGHNLTREQPDFSQITLNKFGITYIHDDSETTSDSFTFRAWVVPLDASSSSSSPFYSASSSLPSLDLVSHRHVKDSLAVTETFNITVTPVNDQPPMNRNRPPTLKVVVGERVILGPDNLQVEDHDTPPEELHYLVISKPNNGYLTLGERPEPVTSFTQYDVNHGRLHFIQQGEPSTGVFYFNVTDGHHRPLYKLFSLEVIKPSIFTVNNTGLSLVQGRTAVILTTNQLAAQTNGQSRANITYTVTTHPRHGRIAINDQEVMTFRHEDLQHGRVVYHMTELSESEDSFQISISATAPGVEYGNVTAQTVKVVVRPLIYLREPVRVPSGIAVKLGKAMMDASELARISRADPVFEVLVPPKHGKLVKMTYDPNRASEVLKSFTFRDVVQGRVAIEETLSDDDDQTQSNESALTIGHAPATPLNDSFVFLLKAGNVQPAKGELHFTILPHHQMHHAPPGGNKADVASNEHKTTRSKIAAGGTVGGGRTHGRVEMGVHPHVLTHKNHNKTHHRVRPHNRIANHTHGGNHGSRSKSSPPPAEPHPPGMHPVQVAVLPRPASDPLLIILPLLACLLLIVILVVLILVLRHRREKQARMRLLQELAAVQLPAEGSPYSGGPERSVAMPSVVVTPLRTASCPASPGAPIGSRRRSLAPGMTFWGPFDAEASSSDENIGGRERENTFGRNSLPAISVAFKSSRRSKPPTLKDSQYWV
ncbi:chondroitin sulfate proteoglycan 4-like isoform X1 [Nerophis ophidion]|uniref:chondroitin sulfate proteoglycan 4-like isoform X1 n=1 Tax=Nerophis ophidion TaxID=159077 RepID=UPI002ADFBA81|nr:chondroitin sulfate proteoglycan 4-like isoform X1 [Nerophis ophidion]